MAPKVEPPDAASSPQAATVWPLATWTARQWEQPRQAAARGRGAKRKRTRLGRVTKTIRRQIASDGALKARLDGVECFSLLSELRPRRFDRRDSCRACLERPSRFRRARHRL